MSFCLGPKAVVRPVSAVLLAILLILAVAWFVVNHNGMESSPSSAALRVLFPIHLLDKESVVNPSNTNTVYEYYLLENLAVGLVRDDHFQPDGLGTALAKSWRVEGKRWVFQLNTDLRWSDGSNLTAEEIVTHFQRLVRTGSRHLQILKSVRLVGILSSNEIFFEFPGKPTPEFLNEMTLADAAVYHLDNGKPNWDKVTGPYSLGARSKDTVELRSNRNSILYRDGIPDKVVLKLTENIGDSFSSDGFDLVPESAMPFTPDWRKVSSTGPCVKEGAYNRVFFVSFHKDSKLVSHLDLRQRVANAIGLLRTTLKLPTGFQADSQIVAPGREGRLSGDLPARKQDLGKEKFQFRLALPAPLLAMPGFKEAFQSAFQAEGIDLVIVSDKDKKDPSTDAELLIFLANQKDQLGNWSFLVTGPLSPFGPLVKESLQVATQSGGSERVKAFSNLNQIIFDHVLLVPLFWSKPRIYYTKSFSLDRWNPFDLRLRFYEIESLKNGSSCK